MAAPHPIPLAALDQPLCIVGTVGSGKTYAAKSAVERLLGEKRRVVIVDPTGVWHGLRTNADGSPGFPIIIFGGEQADVPVAPDTGALLGDLLAQDRVTQAIVDVSEMTGGERTRFLTAMLERLYVGARVPRHLVLDEADEMAAQNPLPEQLRLLGIVDKIVRRGRVRGFRPMMITQRPAVLHKNVLSQIATLVAMRLTSPQDKDAVAKWVKGSADLDEAKTVLASLPKLDVGEGWVWAPREGVLERTRFPAIATLDTSATPETGAAPERGRAMAKVDVGALREALSRSSASVDDAKRDTTAPATSQGSRRAAGAMAPERPASAVEIAEAERRGEARGFERGRQAGWRAAVAEAQRALGDLTMQAQVAATEPATPPTPRPASRAPAAASARPSGPTRTPAPAKSAQAEGSAPPGAALPPSKQKILDAIAWLETIGNAVPARNVVAFVGSISSKSSSYANNVSALRTAGLLDYPGDGALALTPAGRAIARAPDEALTHETMMALLAGKLGPATTRILAAAAKHHPNALSRADLAARAGASPQSSAFANNVSRLSSLGLVTYPASGTVRAADLFFPRGRT